MKPVFKCDYCEKTGTEEEIREHEEKCTENYTKRSCYTCEFRGRFTMEERKIKYECAQGKDIPAGRIYENCELYERNRKEKSPYSELVKGMFGAF